MYLRYLHRVFVSCAGIRNFFLFFILTLSGLFLFSERALLSDVLAGDFPLELFVHILPAVLSNFFLSPDFEYALAHYLLLATLSGMYLTMVVDMFSKKGFISFSSLSVSLAGFFGVTLGITCLSCSILGGYLAFSVLTALSTVGFVGKESLFFLVLGELLLLASILLLVVGVAKISPRRS